MLSNNIVNVFTELVSIPSPSGKEGKVSVLIKKYLDSYSIRAAFDKSGIENDSETGNLIAHIKGKNSNKTLLFVAHMDTVEKVEECIKPIIKDGNIFSDGTTILGADDKGAVACLIEALFEISKLGKYPTVYAAFTTREESGKMGISCAKKIPGVDYVFNLDGQGPQGMFINKSLGQTVFKVQIFGESAHSAINPEKGRNAIAAASDFIFHTKQGRKKNALINIGKINGGNAVNVISNKVVIEGEIRSFKEKNLEAEYLTIKNQLQKSCDLFGCTYKIQILEDSSVPVMENSNDKKMVEIAKKASKVLDLPFLLTEGSFTSEGNFLSAKGYKVLTVCRGGTNAHSNKESITVQELENYKNLIINIAKESLNI